ncbi:MAG TPA: methyltransferase domain-containing protein [Nitrososphaerales archaeon]|nr:methyltransferase domain-containing protein [Nitrososphaerales archaeon]
MSWKYTDEYYTEYTRTTWNESAIPYLKLMEHIAPFTEELLKRVKIENGMKILDIGTGPGEPAITISGRVGSKGHVTGIDLSETMIDLAREATKRKGAQNVSFLVMNAEDLKFPEGSFDLVLCRFGFQIFTNPEKAASEAYKVLRKGGELGAVVWSTGDKVPALHVLVEPMMENVTPDETGYIPTPYELGGPGELAQLFLNSGFASATEDRITKIFHFRDSEDYFELWLKGTPLGHSLREEEESVQKEILRKTRLNLEKWKTDSGFAIPAEVVIVIARK